MDNQFRLKTLEEIIDHFEKFYKSNTELYKPFVKSWILKKREQEFSEINSKLQLLYRVYENPAEAYGRIFKCLKEDEEINPNDVSNMAFLGLSLLKAYTFSDLIKSICFSEYSVLSNIKQKLENEYYGFSRYITLNEKPITKLLMDHSDSENMHSKLCNVLIPLYNSSWEDIFSCLINSKFNIKPFLFKTLNGCSNKVIEVDGDKLRKFYNSFIKKNIFSPQHGTFQRLSLTPIYPGGNEKWSGNLEGSFIIKTNDKKSNSLVSEKNILEYMKNVFSTRASNIFGPLFSFYETESEKDVKICLPIVSFFSDKISYESDFLVLSHDHPNVQLSDEGLQNLPKLPSKKRKKCMLAISEFLAMVHTEIPLKLTQKGKIDLTNYLNTRLNNDYFGLPGNLKEMLYNNFKPVIECLSKTPYVFAKDAILDNFVIYKQNWDMDRSGIYQNSLQKSCLKAMGVGVEGTEDLNEAHKTPYSSIADIINSELCCITALDWEDKGFQPLYFDLVNLLEYSEGFREEEKQDYIQNYIKLFNENKKEDTKKLEYDSEFKLAYLNAIIYRVMCFSSAWSNPNREEYKSKRAHILNKAVTAINKIKQEHVDYYNEYKNNYDSLEDSLRRLVIFYDIQVRFSD